MAKEIDRARKIRYIGRQIRMVTGLVDVATPQLKPAKEKKFPKTVSGNFGEEVQVVDESQRRIFRIIPHATEGNHSVDLTISVVEGGSFAAASFHQSVLTGKNYRIEGESIKFRIEKNKDSFSMSLDAHKSMRISEPVPVESHKYH